MLEPNQAGYSLRERYSAHITANFGVDRLERVVRMILVFCFMGVLGLELWLLISALGS